MIMVGKTRIATSYYQLAGAFIISLSLSLFGTIGHASSPGNLNAPFDAGSSWNVCQGFDNTPGGTHVGSSHLALDLAGSGCDTSAAGRNVRAPFAGTIAWIAPNSGSICVSEQTGRSIMLTHVEPSLIPGAVVQSDQIVGKIAAPGNRQNNGVAHLHIQAWSVPMCTGDSYQVPFDAAHQTRICGVPDFAQRGPNNFRNGTWGSTRFTADSCSITVPPASPSVFRFYSPVTRHHLYTTDVNEMDILRSNGNWNYEGIAYWVKSITGCNSGESVYRFYSEKLQVHLYTMDENEKRVLSGYPQNLWRYEGVGFCASRTNIQNTKPVYRFYSEGLQSHLFTADTNEKNVLKKYPDVWRYEGIAYYVY